MMSLQINNSNKSSYSWGLRVLSLALLAMPALAQTDPPNLELENRLSHVYQKYNSAPTDDMAWEQATKGASQQHYVIVKGDTLWDVSQVVFGDGYFWPKLWSLNKNILNPHEINVGDTLSFISVKQSIEAPELEVIEKPSDGRQPEAIPEVIALTANVPIPDPSHDSKPLADKVPEMFPFWKYSKGPKAIEFRLDRDRPTYATAVKYLPFYVSDQSLEGLGEIVGIEADVGEASLHQYVYVKSTAQPKPHHVYTAVREKEEISGSGTLSTGHLIEVLGELEVQEPVNVAESVYRAVVTKSIHLIPKGATLIDGTLPKLEVTHSGPSPKISASVVWGLFGSGERMYGLDQFVILNRGTAAGLQVGQVFPIFQRFENMPSADFEKSNPRKVGMVRIVKSATNFATALVLQQNEIISTGDSIDSTSVEE
jgi:LysM repeat protein